MQICYLLSRHLIIYAKKKTVNLFFLNNVFIFIFPTINLVTVLPQASSAGYKKVSKVFMLPQYLHLLRYTSYGKRRGSIKFKAFRVHPVNGRWVCCCCYGGATMSEQESLRCSSARNRGGVQRVEGKLRASVEKGDYYEAHQMYRTLFFR